MATEAAGMTRATCMSGSSGRGFLAVAFVFLTSSGLSRAQWIQTAGPEGGNVNRLVSHGKFIFAACAWGGGVFRSSDDGKSWKRVNKGLANTDINGLVFCNGSAFAATAMAGLFRSTNDGDSWRHVPVGTGDSTIRALGVHLSSLFIETYQRGTWRSDDGGAHWVQVRPEGQACVFFSAGELFFAGEFQGMQVSSDNGEHWMRPRQDAGQGSVLAFVSMNGSIFAGTTPGIVVSSDDGRTWLRRDTSLNHVTVYSLAVQGRTLYAGTSSGVLTSTDSGRTWDSRVVGLADRSISALLATGRYVFAATARGIYRSSDRGMTWLPVRRGFLASNVSAIGMSGAHLLAGTALGGVFTSSNGGRTWRETDSGLPGSIVSKFAEFHSFVYAAFDAGGVYRSSDHGKSWSATNRGLADSSTGSPNMMVRDCVVLAGNSGLLCSARTRIFRWSEYAGGWRNIGTLSPGSAMPFPVVDLAWSGKSLLAVSARQFFYSTDNGVNWSNSFPDATLLPGTLAAADSHAYAGGFGLAVSSDNGRTWKRSGASQRRVWSIFAGREFILKGERASLQLSSDCGTTWVDTDEGLPRAIISALAVQGNDVFAGTFGYGVWRRPISDIVASAAVSLSGLDSVFSFQLAKRSTEQARLDVSYRLPCTMSVTLAITDTRGSNVLQSKMKREVKGIHRQAFDLTGRPRGIYLCRFHTGRFNVTKKLLYLGKGEK